MCSPISKQSAVIQNVECESTNSLREKNYESGNLHGKMVCGCKEGRF